MSQQFEMLDVHKRTISPPTSRQINALTILFTISYFIVSFFLRRVAYEKEQFMLFLKEDLPLFILAACLAHIFEETLVIISLVISRNTFLIREYCSHTKNLFLFAIAIIFTVGLLAFGPDSSPVFRGLICSLLAQKISHFSHGPSVQDMINQEENPLDFMAPGMVIPFVENYVLLAYPEYRRVHIDQSKKENSSSPVRFLILVPEDCSRPTMEGFIRQMQWEMKEDYRFTNKRDKERPYTIPAYEPQGSLERICIDFPTPLGIFTREEIKKKYPLEFRKNIARNFARLLEKELQKYKELDFVEVKIIVHSTEQ